MNESELRAKLEALVAQWETMAQVLAPRDGVHPANELSFAMGTCLWWRIFEVRDLLAEDSTQEVNK